MMTRHLRSVLILLTFLTASSLFAATSQDYYNAGLQMYQSKQYQNSIKYLQAAVQLNPQDWRSYQIMGQDYYQMGDNSDALSNFDKSLALNPDNAGLKKFADSLRTSNNGLPPLPAGNRTADRMKYSTAQGNNEVGGPLGLGLELGDPGNWGATGKFWLDHESALQAALKLGGGTVVQLDYLWHDYDVIHPQQGLMPIYFGVGGGLGLGGSIAIEARGIVGISYLFNKATVPVDIYVQLCPAIWIGGGGTSNIQFYPNVGSRYYF